MKGKLAFSAALTAILLFLLSGCVTPPEEKSPELLELEQLTEFATEPPPKVDPSQIGHTSPEGSEVGWVLGGSDEAKKAAEAIKLQGLQLEIKASNPAFKAHENDLTVSATVTQATPESLTVSFVRQTKEGFTEASGTFKATEFNNSYVVIHPFYWPSKDNEENTSLIWLNENAFIEATTVSDTLIRLDFLGPKPSWLDSYAQFLLLEDYWSLHPQQELVAFKVKVNGVEKEVQAVRAFDDMLNEYIILDNPKNALILQLTYHNKSTEGLAGINSLAALRESSGWKVASISTG